MYNVKSIEKCVKGSLAVEGIEPSKKGESITKSYLNGEITSEKAVKSIINHHLNKGGVNK